MESDPDNSIDGRMDPVLFLNEECMTQVLSFAWEKPKGLQSAVDESNRAEGTRQEDTAQPTLTNDASSGDPDETMDPRTESEELSSSHCVDEALGINAVDVLTSEMFFASVSKSWKSFMAKAIDRLAPALRVDFDEIPDELKERTSMWLGEHAFSIKYLRCVLMLDQKYAVSVLQNGNTKNLEYAHVTICLPDDLFRSPQRSLQHLLSTECPKLDTLCVTLFIHANEEVNSHQAISKTLFSRPTIQSLRINVCLRQGVTRFQDASLLCNLIEHLPSLEKLYLTCDQNSLLAENGNPIALRIVSNSLERIDVREFCERAWFELDCPKLLRFVCPSLLGFALNGPVPFMFLPLHTVRATRVAENCVALLEANNAHLPFRMPLSFQHFLELPVAPVGVDE